MIIVIVSSVYAVWIILSTSFDSDKNEALLRKTNRRRKRDREPSRIPIKIF